MIPSRETIYSALYALINVPSMLVANGGPFITITRRPQLWGQYVTGQFPVLGMTEEDEVYEYPAGKGTPPKRTLNAQFLIYTDVAQDPNALVSPELNACIDAVENVLVPPPNPAGNQIQQLGGLVQNAWISGAPKKAPGYTGENGLAIIPFSILVP